MAGFEDLVGSAAEAAGCRHLAVLVHRADELPGVLASFYALGARRQGWLVHRALPGGAARERELLAGAGLPVEPLERNGRLVVHELDPEQPPEAYGSELEDGLAGALGRGLEAMWYARFAVGDDVSPFERVLLYDRHYERRFAGRPTVTLCPFVVGDLGASATLERLTDLAATHDGVAVAGGEGFTLLRGDHAAAHPHNG